MSVDEDIPDKDWISIIRDFLQNKVDAEEEKYLKAELKAIAAQFEKSQWLGDETLKHFFDAKKNKKPDGQTALEFQRQKLVGAKAFSAQPESLDWEEINTSYQNKLMELRGKFVAADWIEKASQNASSVSFATHVVKLTHSKIDTPSVLDQVDAKQSAYLTTSNLAKQLLDGAVAGNQYAPIYQFLELEHQGIKLAQELSNDTSTALKSFARNDEELKRWNAAFKQVSISDEMAAHALLKQVYFPIPNRDEPYDLLCQVTSSSLAQAVFERLFNEQQKQVRAQCDKEKFSTETKVVYPRRANIAVTASNHSNASQLNGRRGGKLHLLSAQPPTWQRQVKPPIYAKSWFKNGIPYRSVKEDIEHMREFLLRFDRLELSTRDPKKKRWLEDWGNRIVDEVLFHANTIQLLPAGWSGDEDIKLKKTQQYFLDPYRDDEAFQAEREVTDWRGEICLDFAIWLNGHLKGKDKAFTPQKEHTALWMKLMTPALRELEQSIKTKSVNQEAQV